MCLLFFRKHQGCLACCVNVKVLISCNGSQARTSRSAGNTAAEAQQQGEGAAAGLRAAQQRGDQWVPEMPEGMGAGLGGWWHVGAGSGVPQQPRRAPQAHALRFTSLRGQREHGQGRFVWIQHTASPLCLPPSFWAHSLILQAGTDRSDASFSLRLQLKGGRELLHPSRCHRCLSIPPFHHAAVF